MSDDVLKNHIVTLDFLRGIAATCVVILHYNLWIGQKFPSAALAVDFFFMLSGFVIALAYEKSLKCGMTLWEFLRVRIIRLYPLIFLSVLIGLISCMFGSMPGHSAPDGYIAIIFALASATLLPIPPFMNVDPYPLNSPQWSLFFEFIANIIYALVLYNIPTRRIFYLIIIVSVPYIYVTRNHGMDVGWVWNNFHFGILRVLLPTLMGLLLWRAFDARMLPKINLPLPLLGMLLVITLAYPVATRHWIAWIISVGLIFPILMIGALSIAPPTRFIRIARSLGALSYPLYIIHMPILIICMSISERWNIVSPIREILIAIVVVGTAYLAGYFYDAPVRRFLTQIFIQRKRQT